MILLCFIQLNIINISNNKNDIIYSISTFDNESCYLQWMTFNNIKVDLKIRQQRMTSLQQDGGLGKTKPSFPRGDTILTIIYGL